MVFEFFVVPTCVFSWLYQGFLGFSRSFNTVLSFALEFKYLLGCFELFLGLSKSYYGNTRTQWFALIVIPHKN